MSKKTKEAFQPSKAQIDKLASYIAGKGRDGDTELAHLTNGELVLPKSVLEKLDPKILADAFKAANRDMGRYTVGKNDDSFNPDTGLREYSDGSQGDGAGNDSGGTGGGTEGGGTTGGSGGGDPDSGPAGPEGGNGPGSGPAGGNTGGNTSGGGTQDPMGDADTYGGDKTDTRSDVGKGAGDYADPMGDADAYGGDKTGQRSDVGKGPDSPTYAEDALANQYSPRSTPRQIADYVRDIPNIAVDKVKDMFDNPARSLINGFVGGPVNIALDLMGLPTVGSVAVGVGRAVGNAVGLNGPNAPSLADTLNGVSVSLAEALGQFAPTDPNNPNPNPDPNRDGTGGGDGLGNQSTTTVAQAQEQATGQAATTIDSSGLNQGTIATTSTDKRRAFSRLTLGSTAGNKASLLW